MWSVHSLHIRLTFISTVLVRVYSEISKSRDSGYQTSRSSYQSSIIQRQSLFNDYQKQSQSAERRIVPSIYDNVLPDLTIMDNCYDVSGDNHGFACTVVNYKKPLADRQSAKNDEINLESSMKRRGYLFSSCTGYVTLEGFRNELLSKLSRMTTATTSFVLSISCHGDGDRLVFSDGKR